MPAAFYELNIEQSSDFLSALRILKPEDGTLFKFLPKVGERFWKNDNSAVNFDIPNEIKLLYPNQASAFGYLQTNAELTFLTVRMKIKDSTGSVTTNLKIEGQTVCKRRGGTTDGQANPESVAGDYVLINESPVLTTTSTPRAIFKFVNRTSVAEDNNITLHIPNSVTNNFKGKYLYDIELEYRIGGVGTTENNTTKFVVRLLQGRVTFNPNITT